MTLLSAFLSIVQHGRPVFPQNRTFSRAVGQALGTLSCLGRRTLTRVLWTQGRQHQNWSSEYLLHSRCRWEPQQLFRPILQRALPVRFQEVSRVKRPGKKATEEERNQYRQAVKQQNLSQSFVAMAKQLRLELDQAGGQDKVLVLAGDGSFCNRTCFGDIPEPSVLIARARKDAKLCFRAPLDSRRFYAVEKFTPELVRQDEARCWKTTKIFYGGKRRRSAIRRRPRCTGSVEPASVHFLCW